jgi:hypothetical protein
MNMDLNFVKNVENSLMDVVLVIIFVRLSVKIKEGRNDERIRNVKLF